VCYLQVADTDMRICNVPTAVVAAAQKIILKEVAGICSFVVIVSALFVLCVLGKEHAKHL
jgi:hypothetical protein